MNLEKLIEALDSLKDNEYVTLANPNIIFKENVLEDGKVYKEIAIPERLFRKIDFSNVSFDNVCICGFDFTGFIGVKIDPQTVYDKDFSFCVLSGVLFDGSFDGVNLSKTNFTGSRGARINPQTIPKKDLSKCKFSGVEFIGPFDGVKITGSNFTGSKGAKINPQTVYNGNLRECKFSGVEFIGPFDGIYLQGSDFTGSKGAKINLQTVYFDDLSLCVLTDAEIKKGIDMENIGTVKSRNTNDETGIINANFKLMRKKKNHEF